MAESEAGIAPVSLFLSRRRDERLRRVEREPGMEPDRLLKERWRKMRFSSLLAEEGGDRAGEIVPGQGEVLEVLELGDGVGDWSGEVGLLVEGQRLEKGEVPDCSRDLPGKVADGHREGGDPVGGLVALHIFPLDTAVGVGFPRGQDVRVIEGLLDGQQGLLVARVAQLGRGRGQEKMGEEES